MIFPKTYPYKQANRFLRLFGVSFNKYWHPLFGFDIVAFDDEFVKSGDGSMKQALIDNWGQEAADFVESLI